MKRGRIMTDSELTKLLAAKLGWCVQDKDGFSAEFQYKGLLSCAFVMAEDDKWYITAGPDCDYDELYEPINNPDHARLTYELWIQKLGDLK